MSILLTGVTVSVLVIVLFCGNGRLTEIIMIVYEALLIHLVNYDIYSSIYVI